MANATTSQTSRKTVERFDAPGDPVPVEWATIAGVYEREGDFGKFLSISLVCKGSLFFSVSITPPEEQHAAFAEYLSNHVGWRVRILEGEVTPLGIGKEGSPYGELCPDATLDWTQLKQRHVGLAEMVAAAS